MSNGKHEDAFGRRVSLGATNEADIGGHYVYSPERFRVFVNGDRQLLQYDDPTDPLSFPNTPEFANAVDSHRLTPQSSDDVITMETTERFRYVVQYVLEWSSALELNQLLQSGDALTLAFGDADLENSTDDFPGPAADGWVWHWHSGLDDDQVRIGEYRAGDVVDATVAHQKKAIDIWTRRAGETNWYNVGNTEFTETFTDDGAQKNPVVGKTSADDARGPETANKPIQLSVKADTGAGSLTADLGSVGARTLGDVGGMTRTKFAPAEVTVDTADTWVPAFGFRIDPARNIVNTQAIALEIMQTATSSDVQATLQACHPPNVRDSSGNQLTDADWSYPAVHNPQNTVVQVTSAVDQASDGTGTVVTDTDDVGGYQLGWASLYTSGQGSKTESRSVSRTRKRQLSDRDIGVVYFKVGSAGGVTFEHGFEQDK